MKATGMVRRMDELGRVVIPKEIRRTMRLHEGEELEIYAQDEGLFMKKYSALSALEGFAFSYAAGLADLLGGAVALADGDQILAAAGSAKERAGDLLTTSMVAKMKERAPFSWEQSTPFVKQGNAYPYGMMCPIVVHGDLFGVLLWGDTSPCNSRQKTALETAVAILGQQLDT